MERHATVPVTSRPMAIVTSNSMRVEPARCCRVAPLPQWPTSAGERSSAPSPPGQGGEGWGGVDRACSGSVNIVLKSIAGNKSADGPLPGHIHRSPGDVHDDPLQVIGV